MVRSIGVCRATLAWVGFALASALSWAAYYWLSATPSYSSILISLAMVNFLLGLWIIYLENRAPRAIIAVIVGLVVGQWWMILWSIVFLVWHTRGFAP